MIPPKDLFYEAAELAKEVDPRWNCRSESFRTLYKKACQYNKGETVQFAGREYPPLYTFKVSSLIQLLKITDLEQREMKVLISQEERKRRAVDKRREKGMIPRNEYRAQAQVRMDRARELKRKGLSVSQIAAEMKLSRRSVHNYLSKDLTVNREQFKGVATA